jgi:hypothetical protein
MQPFTGAAWSRERPDDRMAVLQEQPGSRRKSGNGAWLTALRPSHLGLH